MIAWHAFGMSHDAGADLVVGDHRLQFDLAADVCEVFEELPDVLNPLDGPTPDKDRLMFAEQGTQIKLVTEPDGDGDVRLRIVRILDGGRRFDDIPDDLGTVDRGEFIAGWRQLALDALDYVESLLPELAEDESARSFRRRLTALA